MKKIFLFAAMILITGIAFGQTLQKGNLVGTHVMTVTLQPGVTMEKFIEFYSSKVIPAYGQYFSGCKVYLVKSLRGENKDSFGTFFIFNTAKDRDKYYKPDGSNTDLANTAYAKFKPVYDELAKLGTMTTVYNDWLVL